MANPKQIPQASIYTKVDAPVYDKIVKIAKSERRSLSAQISLILTAWANKRIP